MCRTGSGKWTAECGEQTGDARCSAKPVRCRMRRVRMPRSLPRNLDGKAASSTRHAGFERGTDTVPHCRTLMACPGSRRR